MGGCRGLCVPVRAAALAASTAPVCRRDRSPGQQGGRRGDRVLVYGLEPRGGRVQVGVVQRAGDERVVVPRQEDPARGGGGEPNERQQGRGREQGGPVVATLRLRQGFLGGVPPSLIVDRKLHHRLRREPLQPALSPLHVEVLPSAEVLHPVGTPTSRRSRTSRPGRSRMRSGHGARPRPVVQGGADQVCREQEGEDPSPSPPSQPPSRPRRRTPSAGGSPPRSRATNRR